MSQYKLIDILKLLPNQSQPRPNIGAGAAAAGRKVAEQAAALRAATAAAAQNAIDASNTQVTTPPGTTDGQTVEENIVSVAQPSAGNPDSDPPTRGTTVDSFTNNYFSNIQSRIANDSNLASLSALSKANVELPTDILMTPEKLPEVVKANINPQPTAAQFGNFRRYNKNGIFYKSNLSAVMKRDNKGSVILNIGNK
jgi:hypothetical protein